MIALDTSALIRFLTDDIPDLAARVEKFIEGDEPVMLSSVVLVETIHVLRGSQYRRGNPELADTLVELLAHENVRLSGLDSELASAALAGVRGLSPRHLADALIAAAARQGEARMLVSNDIGFVTDLVEVVQLSSDTETSD